ncbi:predicted protein [Uncinocarpus reesii 1704]|uniref:Glucose-methanol-choline oxidoreductase N-terminal domain-containing protein n=1 Tax=Uncinocarpus reesii (strain UAMH 1704) TaxID=336963 RepID=C4JET4_UNCRE|nr:uncharacterized protein UREG_02244 [Uncinocarpus reesii 1704]EEP77395.1 predicted protein [Uncinocarpus reesii 1704]
MASDAKMIEEFCSKRFDYLILGGGTAGLVLAARLSEDPSITVGVLEAGELEPDNAPTGELLLNFSTSPEDPARDWGFQTEPQRYADHNVYDWPSGKVAGGSSVTNHEILSRGFKAEYDDWEILGNPGWGWEGLLPYFSKVEALQSVMCGDNDSQNAHEPNENVAAEPVEGTTVRNGTRYKTVWHHAWAELGISECNAGLKHRQGIQVKESPANLPASAQFNSMAVYYRPSMHRENLHFLPTILISSVKFTKKEGSKLIATTVEFMHFNKTYKCEAGMEIIICCGTVMSPGILERSGIGSKYILDGFGIETLVNISRVGENLQDHSYSYNLVEMPGEESLLNERLEQLEVEGTAVENRNPSQNGILSSMSNLMSYVAYGQASMGRVSAPSEIDLDAIRRTPLLRKQYDLTIRRIRNPKAPCFQYLIVPNYPSNLLLEPSSEDTENCVGILTSVSTPFSRGSVHIESDNPQTYPSINPKYLEHPLDLRLLRAATRMSLDFLATGAVTSAVKDVIIPCDPMLTERDFDEHSRETCESFVHPIGTCAMMPREDGGVVDPDLIVYGTENLRVVDASIIPLHISGNIGWTVYAIAEKAADMIKSQQHKFRNAV